MSSAAWGRKGEAAAKNMPEIGACVYVNNLLTYLQKENHTRNKKMTTITLKTNEYGSQVIRVNTRFVSFAGRFDSIKKQGSYTWTGTADGRDFVIYGGTKSGGRSNEWFVRWDTLGDFELKANSAAECIRIINNS